MIALSGTGLTNRKFQAGKQAKKLAEKMSIQREFQRQQQLMQSAQEFAERKATAGAGGALLQDDEATTEQLLADYRAKRGVSLMEEHLAKSKKAKTEHTGNGGGRRAFDRETDLLSHGKMDEHKVAKLVQNARELDDRFDKAAVQKSFL